MAYSWVGISNMALTRLGADVIVSFTDRPRGVLCNENYQIAADEIVEEHNIGWTDSIARATLTVDSTAPGSEDWEFRYLLPASPWCLKVLEVEGDPDYVIEGRYLLCNIDESIIIKYAKRITDPTTISANLAKAIAGRIGEKICYRVVQDRLLRTQYLEDCKNDIKKAMAKDSMSRKSVSTEEKGGFTWVNR